jgi:hypothetical protein
MNTAFTEILAEIEVNASLIVRVVNISKSYCSVFQVSSKKKGKRAAQEDTLARALRINKLNNAM